MLKEHIATLCRGEHLSEEQSRRAMADIMAGRGTDAQIAGFLVALRLNGESAGEITGCVRAMREAAEGIDVAGLPVVDTCGTGGDDSNTFNISTAAAIVTAGAGVPVAKHGNRGVSSSSGSADALEHLGVNIEAPPHTVERCVQEVGLGFLFAPLLHRAMKHAVGPRRELGVRTVFNLLGPLTNPAGARRQVLGVYNKELTSLMAEVLHRLGARKALVVHSRDGMDELSVCDRTDVAEVGPEGVSRWVLAPRDLGLERSDIADLAAEGPEDSARIIRSILEGETGAPRDMVALNAGAAIYAGGKAESLQEGLNAARESIDSGSARQVLDRLRQLSHETDE